ncbi:hypothetical protein ACFZ8E_19745 [Methylobacterium sp. HMF5984]|uniref:hypothetical protein n=1 Tax=Methylobacterium sp. HMF5984 TaxID=3367370 RepID=UPI003854DE7F
MSEPLTEASLNRCLRGLAALFSHVSREFASTYAQVRADPREAWANLSAMRARGEMPRDTLGWATSDFDGADSFGWGDFKVQAPTTPPQSESSYTDLAALKSEPVGQPAPEQDPIADRNHPPAAPPPASYPPKTEAAAPEEASRPSSGSSELDGEDRGPAVTDCAPALDQRGLDDAHEDSEAGSGPVMDSLTDMVGELSTHKGATWDEKTQRQHRAVAAMLGDIAGTDDLRQIRHAHLAAYIQNLSNLPKAYGKSSRDAALSIADLVERGRTMRTAGQTEKVGLSPATVNRHIPQLSTIAKYCRA